MDVITMLVGVIEDALINCEEEATPSPLDALYALQDRAEAAEAEVSRLREQVAAMRQIAQLAHDGSGDTQIVYAPLLLRALQDIISEANDE